MTVAAAQRDRYRVLKPIGSGGMSQVFEAFDESLRRTVALKVLHPHLALDPEARARFAREAQATARLRHPNIVEIFDVAALDSNDAFIVTELIHGPTLSAFVAAHPLAPPGELAFLVMHQLACALAHAHQNGVVHRDLKPENVMLSESGGLKLMDFGIARILDSQTRMTMTGTLVGSPLHMAPEIIEGERATPASDIFSAGTILYWLVSGAPPFLGNNASQTLRKILDVEREDLRLCAPFLSERQCALIDRCLERDPARRFSDGGEFCAALETILEEEGIDDPAGRLRALIARPDEARCEMRSELVERWCAQVDSALSQKPPRLARAIERLDRVLCVAPEDARAQALRSRIHRMRHAARRRQWIGRLVIAGPTLALASALLFDFMGGGARLEASESNVATEDASVVPPRAALSSTSTPAQASRLGNEPDADEASTADNTARTGGDAGAPTASRNQNQDQLPGTGKSQGLPLIAAKEPSRAVVGTSERQPPKPVEQSESFHPVGEGDGRGANTLAQTSTAPSMRGAEVGANRRDEVEAAALGRLEVMVQHATHGLTWGRIFLDGKWVNGHAPTWSGEVPVGRHELRVESPCCLAESRGVTVATGDQNPPVVFRLRARPALLSVVSEEACEIWLDGLRRASCADSVRDPVAVPLPPGELRGEVTFVLVRQGKPDVARTERFEAGQARVIESPFAVDE